MPEQRQHGQRTDAFTLSQQLFDAAAAEAKKRHMTRSGFYRYCLAKELNLGEQVALDYSRHRSEVVTRPPDKQSLYNRRAPVLPAEASPAAAAHLEMNDASSAAASPLETLAAAAADKVRPAPPARRRKRPTDEPSGGKS